MPVYFRGDIAKAAPNISHQRLRALLSSREPRVVRFLTRLWNAQSSDITYAELREMILTGQIDADTMERWRQDYSRLVTEQMMPEWKEMIQEAVSDFSRRWPAWSFDPNTEQIAAYTARHAAELVTNSTSQQIEAIRSMVQRAATLQDITVDQLAYVIRPTIGLYKGQAVANLNYYKTVRDTLLKDNPTMRQSTAEKRAREAAVKYAAKQHRYRAHMIARTELAFGYNNGEYNGIRQAQAQGYLGRMKKMAVSAHDERVCHICRAMDGTTVDIDETFPNGSLLPPFHPHCLLPGSKVQAKDIVGGSIRWFEGTAVTLCTASGNELTVTPNHPVLTDHGWVSAGKIEEGDQVFEACGFNGIFGPAEQHDYDMPTSIEKVTDALLMSGRMTAGLVPMSAEDFHGDGADGQVCVVYADGLLTDRGEPAGHKGVEKRRLSDGSVRAVGAGFMSLGQAQQGLLRANAAASRCIRCGGDGLSLIGGEPRHADQVCLASVSGLHAGVIQDPGHRAPFEPEAAGKGETGLSGAVGTDNIIPDQGVLPAERGLGMVGAQFRVDPVLVEPAIQGTFVDAEFIRDLSDRKTGAVKLSRVVQVRRERVSAHVYNLQTKSNVFIAEGIITHNCRCVVDYVEV